MAIDFFGVMLKGRIRQFPHGASANGRTVELWTEPQESTLTDLKALAFVSQLTVDYTFGETVKLAMVLTPPYEDGLALLQSELIRFGVGRLEVEFGYTTGTKTGGGAITGSQLPFSGFLQKPDVSIGKDITITLNALGVGYQLNVVGGTESRTWPNGTTWAEAVEATLKKYVQEDGSANSLDISNLYSDISDEQKDSDDFFSAPVVDVKHVKIDAPAPIGVITKGPRNDWWFVRETIENFGFDMVMVGNEIRIISKTSYFESQYGGDVSTRKHFVLRGNVDPTRNMFPVLSFSSSQEGPWLVPGIGKLVMHDWPVAKGKKEPDINETHAGTEASGAGAEGKVGQVVDTGEIVDSVASGEVIQAGANVPGDPNSSEDRRKAAGLWKDLQMSNGITGEFTTIGVPGLKPGEAVQVSGFEKFGSTDPDKALFNGVYGIQSVRHQIGIGGWTTSFVGCIGAFHKDAMLGRARANKVAVAKTAKIEADKELSDVQAIASTLIDGKKVSKNKRVRKKFGKRFFE